MGVSSEVKGEGARRDVEKFSLDNLVAAWRELYKNLRTEAT